jgi:hypothetical protein
MAQICEAQAKVLQNLGKRYDQNPAATQLQLAEEMRFATH